MGRGSRSQLYCRSIENICIHSSAGIEQRDTLAPRIFLQAPATDSLAHLRRSRCAANYLGTKQPCTRRRGELRAKVWVSQLRVSRHTHAHRERGTGPGSLVTTPGFRTTSSLAEPDSTLHIIHIYVYGSKLSRVRESHLVPESVQSWKLLERLVSGSMPLQCWRRRHGFARISGHFDAKQWIRWVGYRLSGHYRGRDCSQVRSHPCFDDRANRPPAVVRLR